MFIKPTTITLALLSVLVCDAYGQTDVERFDGSFRLESGELITGGYFVENGAGSYIYLDTHGLERAGMFVREGEHELRSVLPTGITIRFTPDPSGDLNELQWHEQGTEPIRGRRVYPHQTRTVRFEADDGTQLEGRLLTPACAAPYPAVVYVGGSGAVDRHNSFYQTFFLQQGIAVLAYDKRGFTTVPDDWREPDLAALSGDAAAAFDFVVSLPEIDPHRVGFFGVSQGGWVVPRAALDSPGASFMVLRAGAAVSEFETHIHEKRQEFRARGLGGLDLDYAIALTRAIYDLALEGKGLAATDELVAPFLDEPWYRVAFGEGPISDRWATDWWGWAQRNFDVSATPHLEQFDGSVLWFLGERDENVPLIQNRIALERAFDAAPGGDQQVVVVEGAPHSFLIPSDDGLPRFAEGYFTRLEEWLAEHGFRYDACWDT